MPLDSAAGSNTASNDLCADYMRQYRQQKRKCDEENGVLRNIIKRAKGDGMNTRALIDAVKATKLDPDVVAADLRDTIRYMGIIHLPMTQAALFENYDTAVNQKTQREDDLWDADDKGYRAGHEGNKIDDCEYDPGTEMHVHWIEAWHKGQAAKARELGPDVKVASTSKRRPSRKAAQPALAIAAESVPAVTKAPRRSRNKAASNGSAATAH